MLELEEYCNGRQIEITQIRKDMEKFIKLRDEGAVNCSEVDAEKKKVRAIFYCEQSRRIMRATIIHIL